MGSESTAQAKFKCGLDGASKGRPSEPPRRAWFSRRRGQISHLTGEDAKAKPLSHERTNLFAQEPRLCHPARVSVSPVPADVGVRTSPHPEPSSRPSAQAFSVIAMFNVMKFSIAILPFSIKAAAEASVSLRRMKVRPALSEQGTGGWFRGRGTPQIRGGRVNPWLGGGWVPGWGDAVGGPGGPLCRPGGVRVWGLGQAQSCRWSALGGTPRGGLRAGRPLPDPLLPPRDRGGCLSALSYPACGTRVTPCPRVFVRPRPTVCFPGTRPGALQTQGRESLRCGSPGPVWAQVTQYPPCAAGKSGRTGRAGEGALKSWPGRDRGGWGACPRVCGRRAGPSPRSQRPGSRLQQPRCPCASAPSRPRLTHQSPLARLPLAGSPPFSKAPFLRLRRRYALE